MLKWYHWTLFGVVVFIALAMSWYSMMDLAYNGFSIPWLLAASISLVFDLGAVFLGLMSIEYAKTQDSGLWAEIGTYVFALTSVYINVKHAMIAGYGLVGMVMFGSAPIVAAVLLKVILSFITRRVLREHGRVVDKLPKVGMLTWVRYRRQTWALMSLAMQKRLVDASDKLDIPTDRHAIFAGQMRVQRDHSEVPEIVQELTKDETPVLVQIVDNSQDLIPARTEVDINDIVYVGELVSVPEWLPKDPKMSLSRIAEICVENGQLDIGTVLQWTRDIKHSDVKYGSVYKAVQRARQKVEQ